jgi:hypothetical protein
VFVSDIKKWPFGERTFLFPDLGVLDTKKRI